MTDNRDILPTGGCMLKSRFILVAVLGAYASLASAPAQTDPQSALWAEIKRQLTGPHGEEYFTSNLKSAALLALKGSLISVLLNEGVSRLVLGLTDPATAEVTLIVHPGDARAKREPKPGAQIEFKPKPQRTRPKK